MDTIKIDEKNEVFVIAHRGCSGLEQENTHAAFVAAGNRSYFGIETDVHVTKDRRFVVIHDDNTKRVVGDELIVEESSYDVLRNLLLFQKDGKKGRNDLKIPNLEEYISICKNYEKVAILELKNEMTKDDIYAICECIQEMNYMDKVIFISFNLKNLICLRDRYPEQPAQYLLSECKDDDYETLLRHHLDLDIFYKSLTEDLVKKCHADGIRVNCWTVNKIEDAERLIEYGVDFLTTNILE